jgi:protein KTI12
MTRWDSPYFAVVWEDESPPVQQIWDAMIGAPGVRKVVKSHQATMLVSSASWSKQ